MLRIAVIFVLKLNLCANALHTRRSHNNLNILALDHVIIALKVQKEHKYI